MTAPTATGRLLAALEASGSRVVHAGDGYMFQCPAHDDTKPSLSIGVGDNGTPVIKCHAGCRTDDVLSEVGMTLADLFSDMSDRGNTKGAGRLVQAYPYVDESGAVLFEVVRFAPKDFRQRRPDGTWGINGVRRVLYRLPEVIAAAQAGKIVYIVEGEKDADALAAAGVTATTNPGGTGGGWRDDYSKLMRGATVVIVSDRDEPGEKHAANVAASLKVHGILYKIVNAKAGKDAADHLAAGHGVDDFVPIELVPPSTDGTVGHKGRDKLRNPDLKRARPVKFAWRGRIPLSKPSLLVGNEGIGKGATTAALASKWSHGTLEGDLLGAPAAVLIVGDEDALDDVWTPRLHAAEADFSHVFFMQEDADELDLTSKTGIDRLEAWIEHYGIKIVVFDALLDHLGAGTDEFRPKAVRQALRPLRGLARRTGIAALGALHPKKGQADSVRDLVAASHQFNAVSRSTLLIAKHPDDDDEDRRVLLVGKSNHARAVPALEFALRSERFNANGHDFDEPRATEWKESTVKVEQVLPGAGGKGGNFRDPDAVDKVEAALSHTPKVVRDLATQSGVSKSTVDRILKDDLRDVAHRTKGGWVLSQLSDAKAGTKEPQSAIFDYDEREAQG